MKSSFLILSLVLAAALTGHATTVIRITGSPLMRAATHAALAVGNTAVYTGDNLSRASAAVFYTPDNSFIYKTSWSDSAPGIAAVAHNETVSFLPDNALQSIPPDVETGYGYMEFYVSNTDTSIPDVAMSALFQNITGITPYLSDTKVGVQPYKWISSQGLTKVQHLCAFGAGSNQVTVLSGTTSNLTPGMSLNGTWYVPGDARIGQIIDSTTFTMVKEGTTTPIYPFGTTSFNMNFYAPASFDSVTPGLAQLVWLNGSAPLSMFTGNHGDQSVKIFALGQATTNNDRLNFLAESGVGINSYVVQYQPAFVGPSTVSSHTVWPPLTPTDPRGSSGYADASSMWAALTYTTSGIGGYYLTYADIDTANNHIYSGAKEHSWNGVRYSLEALQEGAYTFWSYHHVMYKSYFDSPSPSDVEGLAKKDRIYWLKDAIKNTHATIKLSTMNCLRVADGGDVFSNF